MPAVLYSFLAAALAADLFTKALAVLWLQPGTPVDLVPGLVSLNLVGNDGVAFGTALPAKNFVTAVLIFCMFGWWRAIEIRKPRFHVDATFGLMLGGAIGNGIERFAYGTVTDFLDLKLFVCNLADVALTVGVLLLIGHDWAIKKWESLKWTDGHGHAGHGHAEHGHDAHGGAHKADAHGHEKDAHAAPKAHATPAKDHGHGGDAHGHH